jgi:hypothetical protein
MPKKKQLTLDPNTNKLSRLASKHLPLVAIKGLDEGDNIAPFGTLASDIICYHLYDTNDNYLASGEVPFAPPKLPNLLDVGSHVRGLGYERGTYKIVYNFLRQLGGSTNTVLVKKSDKSIYTAEYFVDTDGKIYAGTIENPLKEETTQKPIELFVQEDKFWIQELSPSRTEIRIRPNPAINDPEYFENFRLLGFTCLSFSDVTGNSHITFLDSNTTTIVGGDDITLTEAMNGGTLIIRDAFIIDYQETPEVISRYSPAVEQDVVSPSENLISNGDFKDGEHISELINPDAYGVNEIVEFSNPGHSKYCLRMTSVGGVNTNSYRMKVPNLILDETYILSCWVAVTEDWNSLKDQGIFFIQENSQNVINYPEHGIELEEKVIDGQLWKRMYQKFTATNSEITWILGYNGGLVWDTYQNNGNGGWINGTGNTSGYRYFTDVQIEPGSPTGQPTPYMIGKRIEEEEVPITGLITFAEDDRVEGIFSTDDDGFLPTMAADVNGERKSGILTIKNAFVTDEAYTQGTEVTVIDDIPITNPIATDIKEDGYEGEFLDSPYHVGGSNTGVNVLTIRIQCDNSYTLYKVDSGGNSTEVGSHNNWRQAKVHTINSFTPNDKLRLEATNQSGPAAFIAVVRYMGATYRTGDGEYHTKRSRPSKSSRHPKYGHGQDSLIREDEIASSGGVTEVVTPGIWHITEENGELSAQGWRAYGIGAGTPWGKSSVHPYFFNGPSEWIWGDNVESNQTLTWEWEPAINVTNEIWRFWDPVLHSDAVNPVGWTPGFNAFNYSGEASKTNRSHWRSGWVGHHGKWVQGEGELGDTCMKFIDQNSQYNKPNHTNYQGLYKTGGYTGNDNLEITHRWQGISQRLPHTFAAQGIQVGDSITVTWRQKSDTIGKGADVGLYHKSKASGTHVWGEVGEVNPAKGHRDHEFLRYVPCAKVGQWEEASYTGVIDDDWNLNEIVVLYVYGQRGPEGILWVENVQIQLTTATTSVEKSPTTNDLVVEIDTFVDKNTVILKDGYSELATTRGHIINNDSNIQSYTTFHDFHVDYTSSLAESNPVYGSLRGEIVKAEGNQIILKNSYQELGAKAGHDDGNDFAVDAYAHFDKWFIQYPMDKSEDLSKLLKTGPNDLQLITNFKIDQTTYPEYPFSVVYKLYKPLPSTVAEQDFCTIVKEMIPPVEETCTLIPFVEEWVSDSVLRPPERFNLDSPIGTGITRFKNYDHLITDDDGLKGKIGDEVLSGSLSADINIDHKRYENFIHFSSAEQRVRNFKYKLDLIEQYTDRSASLAGTSSGSTGIHGVVADPGAGSYLLISGSTQYNPPFTSVSGSLVQIQWWEKQRRETINNFDKFEKYMYGASSSYASESIGIFHPNSWPKRGGSGTYSSPYINYRTSQSVATTWYSNQLVSASEFDIANKNRLRGHLPMFVQDDDENKVFLKFIDMVGHYFDDIWVFVKAMTDVHDKRDALNEGIAKDLLHHVAQSLGWEVFDGKDLVSLPRYMFGMEQTGSEKPWQFSLTPDRDISREIWSRVLNNIPYFLKTKGTTRAIKGLINCYGIPSSILRVIEYGGPKLPGAPQDTFVSRKFTKALKFFGASNNTYVQNDTWEAVTLGDAPTDRHPDTVEFRFSAASGSNQVLVRRDEDWAIRLKDNDESDRYGYVSFMLSGSEGYQEISSSEFPVYDGEFWSVMLTRTLSGSGDFLTGDTSTQDVVYTLYTKKYEAGRSKIVYESNNELLISGSMGAVSASYNSSWTGSGDTITLGGPEFGHFGESLSGSMMEYRNWTTPLNEDSFDNHVAAPIAFDGNTPSASYLDLVTRYSFDDNKDLSVGANQWFNDVSADQSFTSSAVPHNYTSIMGDHFSSVVDESKMKVPNLGPSRRTSNKLRIETDTLIDKTQADNPILKFKESITVPAYDNAAIDSNKVAIFFSPSAVIDEDIITSMPNLDFDQYIGDPRDQYNEQYTGLKTARNLYWQKYSGPNNFWDYLRLLKYYDNSLYRQIRDLVPARANANIGILVEPTILERDKVIIGNKPDLIPSHWETNIDVITEYVSESAEYPNFESNLNFSNPFGVNSITNETGSVVSASSEYTLLEPSLTYTNPFGINFHTQETGSYITASAIYQEMFTEVNLHREFGLNPKTRQTGSAVEWKWGDCVYNAPSDTIARNANETGSFVMKTLLETPSLYNIGDVDYSGWYGTEYYNATIVEGAVKSILEEVVQPNVEENVLSEFNLENEYFYSSSLSASKHIPYSSSYRATDLDNRWDEFVGTERLFYLGCIQTEKTTVTDNAFRYDDNTPAVEITVTSPTKLVTTDSPSTPLDVQNK